MKILLIGGTGVLSSAVAKEALKQGIAVTMINRGHRMNAVPDNVELIKSDKNDFARIEKALEGRSFDAVIDFLILSSITLKKSFEFYRNYTKQYFFISSCAVYDTRIGEKCKEDSKKTLPFWSYSVQKWESEQALDKLARHSDTKVTVVRPSVTYGDTRIPYGIVPRYGFHWTLAARILAGKPIIRWNEGKNRCNMTRVEDFAVGVVGLIGNHSAYGEAFNVCGDECPTFNDVLQVLSDYLKKEVITVDVTSDFYAKEFPSKSGEILGGRSLDAINSNEKLKSVVPEFKQTIMLKQGIAMTLDAYKQNNYQHGIEWSFDGDTDRIVKKWCKINHIDSNQYNLEFVDYLGNATSKDRHTYWLSKHKDNIFIKTSSSCAVFYKRVMSILGRIYK